MYKSTVRCTKCSCQKANVLGLMVRRESKLAERMLYGYLYILNLVARSSGADHRSHHRKSVRPECDRTIDIRPHCRSDPPDLGLEG